MANSPRVQNIESILGVTAFANGRYKEGTRIRGRKKQLTKAVHKNEICKLLRRVWFGG